jgi:hypothetical protein
MAHIEENHNLKQNPLTAFTALYLSIPSLLFAYGWLRLPYTLVTMLLITIFILFAMWDIYRPGIWRDLFSTRYLCMWIGKKVMFASLVMTILILTAWLFLSGVGGFGFQNPDYEKHNALFMSLITHKWPLFVGNNAPLVYYLAYYLPAASVGKLFGWRGANFFMFFWTFVGIILSFIWFWKSSAVDLNNRKTHVLGLVLIFCLAGGLDILGYYLLHGKPSSITIHIEGWAKYFQYSSNTTLIYWVPQHAIATWLLTGVLINSIYQPQNIKYLGLCFAFAILWSPFGVIGTLPFLLWIPAVYFSPGNRPYLFHIQSIFFHLSSLWIGGINFLYIISNRYDFPRGFIWEFIDNKIILITRLLGFLFIEIGFIVVAVIMLLVFGYQSWHQRNKLLLENWKAYLNQQFNISHTQFYLFVVAIGVLTLFPLLKMGYANDLVMRGSIPALFFFWAFISKIVMDSSNLIKRRLRIIYLLILILIIIGFYSGVSEISRSITNYHFGTPARSEVSSLASFDKPKIIRQMKGSKNSFFFQFISK